MRHLILAASVSTCALLAAAPAAAQPAGHYAPPPPHAAPRLPPAYDPAQAADRIGRLADAIMDIDLGPLVDAIEPGARYRGGPTSLGALAQSRDPYARQRMHAEIAGTSAGLGAAARDAAVMAPLAKQALARLMRDVDAASRGARAGYGEVPPPRYRDAPPPPPPPEGDGPGW